MEVLAITQARTGSTRLPNKILRKVDGRTLLEIHLQRILSSSKIDKVIVATTIDEADDAIEQLLPKGVAVYRGSIEDVLDRFYQAAKESEPEWVIRFTSDCPLIDPQLIDQVVEFAQKENVDYCSNTFVEAFPDGQDIEVFKFSALKEAWESASLKSEREHVTPYIRKNSTVQGKEKFKSINYQTTEDYGHIRMTVDEQKDFDLIERLILDLGTDRTWREYADHINANGLGSLNSGITRNEGLWKSLKSD